MVGGGTDSRELSGRCTRVVRLAGARKMEIQCERGLKTAGSGWRVRGKGGSRHVTEVGGEVGGEVGRDLYLSTGLYPAHHSSFVGLWCVYLLCARH